MPHLDPRIDCAAMAVLAKVIPCVQVLRSDSLVAGHSLEPRLAQLLVPEHGDAPEIEAHASTAALLYLFRQRHLRPEVQHRIARVAPNLWHTSFALGPVEAAYAIKLLMRLHRF